MTAVFVSCICIVCYNSMWVYYIHTKSSHYISIETEPEYLEDVHDFPGFTQIQKRAAHPRQKMLFEDYGAIRNTLVVICDSIDRFFAPYFPAPSNKPAITESAQETSPKDRISFILETIGLPYPAFHLSMQCFWCTIVDGTPVLKEHEAARWLDLEHIDSVEWLPADLLIIPWIKDKLFDQIANEVLMKHRSAFEALA